MNSYVTGDAIRALREKKGYTQKELADRLCVSDKTVSKWETGRGLPDITLIEPIASTLGVSVAELLRGEWLTNRNRCGNMQRGRFYVCPVCGNVLTASGEGAYSCCGILLPPLEAEEAGGEHALSVGEIDGELYVSAVHPMEKDHYLSFLACVTQSSVQIAKLYPEQSPEARFRRAGDGIIYAFCNRHGLFSVRF